MRRSTTSGLARASGIAWQDTGAASGIRERQGMPGVDVSQTGPGTAHASCRPEPGERTVAAAGSAGGRRAAEGVAGGVAGGVTASRFPRFALLLALFCALLAAPAFLPGEIAKGHDGRLHLAWQKAFSEVVWSGTLYPRWLPQMNEGFGSPVFFIYPPLSHMVAAALEVAAPLLPGSQARLAAATLAGLWFGGIGMHAWMRSRGLGNGAAVAALFYVAAPYHLFVDVYLRAAFAEAMAFAFLPWIFRSVDRIASRPAGAFVSLALGVAALLLTHLPTSLAVLPLCGLYALLVYARPFNAAALATFAAAAAAGTLLAGGYLGTALTQEAFINIEGLYGHWSLSWSWLLGGPPWSDPGTQRAILIVTACQALVFAGAAVVLRVRRVPLTAPTAFCLGSGLLALFMMTAPSDFLWRLETPLNRIQFPWRLLVPQALVTAALLGTALDGARRAAVLGGGLAAALVALNGGLLVREDALVRLAGAPEAQWTNRDAWEYRLGDVEKLGALFPAAARAVITTGRGTVDVVAWEPRRIVLRVDASGPATVAVRQFSYTGWFAVTDGGEPVAAPAQARPGEVVRFAVSGRGEHRVVLELASTNAEALGWWLSAAGLVVLVFLPLGLGRPTGRRRRLPA